jgi:hypothetical protein
MLTTFVPSVLSYMGAHGVDVTWLIERFELRSDAATVAWLELPTPQIRAFSEDAARHMADPFLGHHVALSVHRTLGGIAETLLRNAPRVGIGLEQVCHRQRLLSPHIPVDIRCGAKQLTIELGLPQDPQGAGRQHNEYVVAKYVGVVRELSRRDVVPRKVWFSHGPPGDRAPLHDYFETSDIAFEQRSCGIAFAADVHALPVIAADASVYAAIEKVAASELAALAESAASADVVHQVRLKIRRALEEGEPTVRRAHRATGRDEHANVPKALA